MKARNSRYYWIKLNVNFFDDDSPMDYIMSMEHGSEYVCIYLKICAMSANKGGVLTNQIGDVVIPYDVKKITREAKYFSEETVMEALDVFAKLGLIHIDENDVISISEFENMVGSETKTVTDRVTITVGEDQVDIKKGDRIITDVLQRRYGVSSESTEVLSALIDVNGTVDSV